jgi:hypothetical protein
MKRWIRASCPAQRGFVKKRGFCRSLRHLRRLGTSLCLVVSFRGGRLQVDGQLATFRRKNNAPLSSNFTTRTGHFLRERT